MLKNFPISKTYNLGGLVGFKFIHSSAVETWPGVFNGKVTTSLTLKAGHEWLTGYSTPETLSFDEEGDDNPNGPIYDRLISGFVPGEKDELLDLMSQMQGQEFILLIKDPNQKQRLIGSHGTPVLFGGSYNTGATRQDLRGFKFKFTGKAIFRAPIYLPA